MALFLKVEILKMIDVQYVNCMQFLRERRVVITLSFILDIFHYPFLEFSVNNYLHSLYDLGKAQQSLPLNKETKVKRG